MPSRQSSKQPATSGSALGWKTELKRLSLAGLYVFLAVVSLSSLLASILSHVAPHETLHILLVFLGWPLDRQVLVIGGVATIVGCIAVGKQLYERYQRTLAVTIAQEGAATAIKELLLAPFQAMFNDLKSFIAGEFNKLLKDPDGPNIPPPPPPPPPSSPSPPPPLPELESVHSRPSDYFLDRETELKDLVTMLQSRGLGHDTTVVYGEPGIGKSALIQQALDQVGSSRSQDTVIFVDCAEKPGEIRKEGSTRAIAVIHKTLKELDQNRREPATFDLEVLRQVSARLLSDQERLIVLDSVESGVRLEDIVYALRTPQHQAHLLIVTTDVPSPDVAPLSHQLKLVALGTTTNLNPDGQSVGETKDWALELFAHSAGKNFPRDFGEDLRHAERIVRALSRHTLSMKLMGNHVLLQPRQLAAIADHVEQMAQVGMPDPEIEGVLKPVYVALEFIISALNEDARRLLFAFVAAFSRGRAGRQATLALGVALKIPNVVGAIDELLRRELMESQDDSETPRGDYSRLLIHTSLLTYVNRQLALPVWQALAAEARDAAATFYATYCSAYDVSDPAREHHMILDRDAENIERALTWANAHHQHAQVVAIARGMRRYWHDGWLTITAEEFLPKAIDSANALEALAKQDKNNEEAKRQSGYAAELSFTLGRVYRREGKFDEAERLFRKDLAFRLHNKQQSELAQVYHQFAQLERSRGNMKEGLWYCHTGLEVVGRYLPHVNAQDSENEEKLKQAKGLLIAQEARIQRSRGELRLAENLFNQALKLFEETGDLLEQGVALGYLGRIARVSGDLEGATKQFEQSKNLAKQAHDSRGMGVIETQFGRIYLTRGDRERGDLEGAKKAFEVGLEFAQRVADMQAVAVNLNYLGRIALIKGDFKEARGHFEQSRKSAEEHHDRQYQGVNWQYLGRLARQEYNYDNARHCYSMSLRFLRAVEDHRGQARVLGEMARLDLDQKRLFIARWRLSQSLRLIQRVGDKINEGTIQRYFGDLEIEAGHFEAAEKRFTKARELAQQVGSTRGEEAAQTGLDRISAMRVRANERRSRRKSLSGGA